MTSKKIQGLVLTQWTKTIRSNTKKAYCTICRNITHLKCITSNKKISSSLTQNWMCSTCIQSTLPFIKVRDLHVLDSSLMNRCQFDTIAVSKTWLKDNKTQLEYVQNNGYSSVWKNRESKTGGVGYYIKEHMSFKVRHDLVKIDESIEILWIELRGRNKNTPF